MTGHRICRCRTVAVVAWFSLAAPVLADAPQEAAFDWAPWRYVPVQDGGRYKPLDTLAWETLRTLSNRASFPDPETGQKLDATAPERGWASCRSRGASTNRG